MTRGSGSGDSMGGYGYEPRAGARPGGWVIGDDAATAPTQPLDAHIPHPQAPPTQIAHAHPRRARPNPAHHEGYFVPERAPRAATPADVSTPAAHSARRARPASKSQRHRIDPAVMVAAAAMIALALIVLLGLLTL
ncbi:MULTISPECIES: hypothetical protein [unclassified Gordonia (in: high G+C Gram-positive bacteria)]